MSAAKAPSREELARVAGRYFAAVAGRDLATIRSVFAPDAELSTVAGVMRGRDEIAGFYEKLVFPADELDPHPGEFVIDGEHLAVEIELHMNGNVSRVADIFTIRGSEIVRLGIFNGANLGAGGRG